MGELLTDVGFLSRFQFAFTVIYHFLFVPLSIGLGLILALTETRYYKTRNPKDRAATKFWVRVFTATFAVGVATGITMEFAFGTNWANYSRFVGDIFGAPLAAEALFAFFLESVFLGVMIFGRDKVSPKFYMVSAWLVWLGSALSALWILIANSWMQTPAGYEVINTDLGQKAVLTDFFAAAFNPSTGARYFHTVDALLILGAFLALGLAAYYLKKGRFTHFAKTAFRIGAIVAVITTVLMLPFAHQQAVVVAETQPMKLAAMEAQWVDEPAKLYLFGIVDEANQTVYGPAIPGGTSWLASFDANKVYPGLNSFPQEDVEALNVPFIFYSYHIMVALYGAIVLVTILALWASFKKLKHSQNEKLSKGLLNLFIWAPLFPMLAIQFGWAVTEVGRQPYVVYGLLKTEDAISMAVSAPELIITILLFMLVYGVIFVTWVKTIVKYIKNGPVVEDKVTEALIADNVHGETTTVEKKGRKLLIDSEGNEFLVDDLHHKAQKSEGKTDKASAEGADL
ncbi:MAG: cytochrome ubiquinol oxidase subunit I [Coriobacteriia bacterium]|nr:cytochrome ubiquinol oxidase subunit I [Coriobacteriia bacterium]